MGMQSVTTEDLKATCQNFPHDEVAPDCATELERRIGPNQYTDRVRMHWASRSEK